MCLIGCRIELTCLEDAGTSISLCHITLDNSSHSKYRRSLTQCGQPNARVDGDQAFLWQATGILNCSTSEKLTCTICCEYVELEQETPSQTVMQLKNGSEKDLCEIRKGFVTRCVKSALWVMSGAARGTKKSENYKYMWNPTRCSESCKLPCFR